MSTAEQDTEARTQQIAEAAKLAFNNSEYFEQVLETITAISLAQPVEDITLQLPCVEFIYRAYCLKKIKSFDLRCKCSPKLIDVLCRLVLPPNAEERQHKPHNYLIVERSIRILASSYDLIFYHMIKNPDKKEWLKLCRLRDYIVSKWPSAYPLLPYNRDLDWSRSIGCKNAITRFIGVIIKTHIPPVSSKGKNANNADEKELDISIALVNKDHPFLYNSNIGAAGHLMLTKLLGVLNDDILLPTPVFSTILSVLMALFRLRPNVISTKFLNYALGYEADLRKTPKFDSDKLKFKLNRRFNDRLDKILVSLLLDKGFINRDQKLKTRFENKLHFLVDKANTQRKRGIMNDMTEEDEEVLQHLRKKRKLDKKITTEKMVDFYNEAKVARDDEYKAIYSLLKPGDPLENFDMSAISTDLLSKMVLTALRSVEVRKLVKALDIVADRYIEIVTRNDYAAADAQPVVTDISTATATAASSSTAITSSSSTAASQAANNVKHEEDENSEGFSEDEVYAVPLPKALNGKQTKERIKVLIDNFIRLADENVKEGGDDTTSNNLSKLAISKWKNDSWIKILCRLATRGTSLNGDVSNYIRDNLLEYFEGDIKGRLSGVIEWLNEEYYSAMVKVDGNDLNVKLENQEDADLTVYLDYTSKVLDNLIPFLDVSDRKIFIRLLSELPYLNKDMISKIKSICLDPARVKLGFQSLLYLIMFRPPVFSDCIDVLKEMHEDALKNDNESLKSSCVRLLKKYDTKGSYSN